MLDPFGEELCSSESVSDTEVTKEVVETLSMQILTGDGQYSPSWFKSRME